MRTSPKPFCIVAAILLAGSAAAQSPERGDPDLLAKVDAVVAARLAKPPAVGFSVAIARGGEVLVEKGYGKADLEFDAPADAHTMFRIGSVTKQFTAALIVRAARDGKLSFADELGKHVPEFPLQGKRVTIEQLLDHTSGIPSYTDVGEAWQKLWPMELSHAELLALVADKPFDFEPGTEFRYNNTGYYLLGMVLEKVHGKSYAKVVADELAKPLGLRRLRYDSNGDLIKNRAQGYTVRNGRLANDEPLGMSQPGAAGALLANAGDLVRWSMALAGGKVVTPEDYARMCKPTVLPDGSNTGYGFGLVVTELLGQRAVHHGGGIHGFNSALIHLPGPDLHVAVVSNLEQASSERLAKDLLKSVLAIPEFVAKDLPVPAELQAQIVGTFHLAQIDLNLQVRLENGKLVAQGDGQRAFGLLFQGEREFRAEFDHEVKLEFGADGKSLTLHQGGGVFVGKRRDQPGGW